MRKKAAKKRYRFTAGMFLTISVQTVVPRMLSEDKRFRQYTIARLVERYGPEVVRELAAAREQQKKSARKKAA